MEFRRFALDPFLASGRSGPEPPRAGAEGRRVERARCRASASDQTGDAIEFLL